MGVIETIKRQEREKGIQFGIEKGKREESIVIALEFKKMGLPIADIAKGTGLTIEELEKLKCSLSSSLPRDMELLASK
jgi:predicted transposase/invertase (TIGR01784 family)